MVACGRVCLRECVPVLNQDIVYFFTLLYTWDFCMCAGAHVQLGCCCVQVVWCVWLTCVGVTKSTASELCDAIWNG